MATLNSIHTRTYLFWNIQRWNIYISLFQVQVRKIMKLCLGMILLSELSRRRIRSINKLVRVGRDECAVVVRVDREKGYIDLSKRRLSDDEKKRCENKFEKVEWTG